MLEPFRDERQTVTDRLRQPVANDIVVQDHPRGWRNNGLLFGAGVVFYRLRRPATALHSVSLCAASS